MLESLFKWSTFDWYSNSHVSSGLSLIGLSLNGDETDSFCHGWNRLRNIFSCFALIASINKNEINFPDCHPAPPPALPTKFIFTILHNCANTLPLEHLSKCSETLSFWVYTYFWYQIIFIQISMISNWW